MSSKLNYKIIVPVTEEELKSYYDLRFEILRKPWGQTEDTTKDDWEDQSLHVLVIDDNNSSIATGRLQYNSEKEGQIRSMAVKEEYRGNGLGTEVLKYIEEKASEKNLETIVLDARDKAVDFYLKNGYTIEGPSYTLFEVIPHFRMIKKLS
jgi:predicted GNAT family N-acyltransferase